jgi:hypothetical protein
MSTLDRLAKLHPLIAWKVTICVSDKTWREMSEEEADRILEKIDSLDSWLVQCNKKGDSVYRVLLELYPFEHLLVNIEKVDK